MHDISELTGGLITENISHSVSLQSMCKCQQKGSVERGQIVQ